MHRDGEYEKHESAEINFWVPLTAAYGSNTLYAESEPELADFNPFELEPGQGARFNGQQCRHYTVPNRTEHTRVSIDFRAVPLSLYRGDYAGFMGDYGVCEIRTSAVKQ